MTEKELLALLGRVKEDPDAWDVVIDATRAVVADNEALRRQITSLRGTVAAALSSAQALWDAASKHATSVWAMIGPYLEPDAPMGVDWDSHVAAGYEHDRRKRAVLGVHSTCRACDGILDYYEETAGNGDILNAWWSHRTPRADGHDAQPVDHLDLDQAQFGGPA